MLRGPKNFGNGGALETRFSTTCVTVPNLIILGDTSIIITDPSEKKISRVPPFKVTKGLWSWHGSIGFIWLPISDPQ